MSILELDTMKRPAQQKATTEAIVAAYRETGSVWKAGKSLGMAGQSIHERLRAIDYPLYARDWSADEDAELAALVTNGVPLGEIAHRLGRPYAGVACRASRQGVKSVPKRQKKIPRGVGFDKVTVARHLKALERSDIPVTRYARRETLSLELLVQAIQKHFPERWAEYVRAHSSLPSKACDYCASAFIPANGRQAYCHRKCASDARADRSYFGGNRRSTVGLAEGVCQLCGRTDAKGLSSHHVLGKENDPHNMDLVALCRGCHKIVGHLAGRAFVDDPRAWESLIALAWMRKHGAEIYAGPVQSSIYTEVSIELWDEPAEVPA